MFSVKWGGLKAFAKNMTKLNDLASKTSPLEVGFEAPYAIWVHENMSARHDPPGQAKFLETAFRTNKREMISKLKFHYDKAIKAKHTKGAFARALLITARFLKNKAQEIIPVDTGCLYDSWFIGRIGGTLADKGPKYGDCHEDSRPAGGRPTKETRFKRNI